MSNRLVSTLAAAAVAAAPMLAAPVAEAAPAPDRARSTVRTYSYGAKGVRVATVRDVRRLRGASDSFQDFTVREVRRQRTEVRPGCAIVLHVKQYRTDGLATGTVGSPGCGTRKAVWAKQGGAWGQVWTGRRVPTCKALTKATGRNVVRGTFGCR